MAASQNGSSSGKIPKSPKKTNRKSSSSGKPKSKNNKVSKAQSKGSNNSTSATFAPSKKSKKAKNKKKKSKTTAADEPNIKSTNGFVCLDSDTADKDDIDSDDELVQISSASESESENENKGEVSGHVTGNVDKEIVLLDEDSDDEVIEVKDDDNDNDNDDDDGGGGDDDDDQKEQPPLKRRKLEQSNMDDDYIAFDFSSDEDDNDKEDYSAYDDNDNEYLSNDEGSYHSENINHKVGAINDEFPWIRNSDHSKEREMSDWLTSEIKDFVKYISPSKEEIKNRNAVIKNLREHIKSIWPDAELHCFGSFATDLYLPGSDIDCVVISKRGRYDNKSSLYQLTSYIRNHKLGVEVTPIAKAKVPIIKFIDPKTRIHIDISFERSNGLTAAKLIIDWIAKTPGLRELVLIVKHFLAVRKLNEVHVGGLGGFSIICLVYSFLKLHPRLSTDNIDPLENLGCLLIEFFELYGYNFGYDNVALAFTSDKEPIYVNKRSNPDLLGRNPFSLAIQDPFDSSNNISRGSFNLKDIKRAFGGAFELLVNKCYELNAASYKQRLGKSILGGIIKYKGKQRDFLDARNDVQNVAFHAASSKSKTTSSNGLPLLPSEKAGIDVDDFYMSDSYYTEEESDDNGKKTENAFEASQKPQKSKKTTNQKPEELLAIKDDNSDDNYTPPVKVSKKEPDFTDSDDDYNPETTTATSHVLPKGPSAFEMAKQARRDFWAQKSGNNF